MKIIHLIKKTKTYHLNLPSLVLNKLTKEHKEEQVLARNKYLVQWMMKKKKVKKEALSSLFVVFCSVEQQELQQILVVLHLHQQKKIFFFQKISFFLSPFVWHFERFFFVV